MNILWGIVPAGGIGKRFLSDIPKQYQKINDRFLLDITLSSLLAYRDFSKIVLCHPSDDPFWPQSEFFQHTTLIEAPSGEERINSVWNGLKQLSLYAKSEDWVLVHDAVRPCLKLTDLECLIHTVKEHPVGGLLASPVIHTLKRSEGQHVQETVDRKNLWLAHTPQMFRFSLLYQAIDAAIQQGLTMTDDASAIEALGLQPLLVPGRADNIKITVPEDLETAYKILSFASIRGSD